MDYDSSTTEKKNPIIIVNRMVERAEEYLDEQSKQREQALEYYEGKPSCIPHNEGRSFSVSKDLRSVVKKVMPSIMRTIFGSNKAVQYEPVEQGDEEGAEQASDYVNLVIMRETQSKKAIEAAIFDALVLKTGILEWCAVEKTKVVVTDHVNLSDEEALGLIDGSMGEVLDYSKEPETDPLLLQMDPQAMRHTFKLRRKKQDIVTELRAVPRGSFLITPNAQSIEDAPLVGKKMEASRSDLVAQGYNKDDVAKLKCVGKREDDDRFERMGDDWTDLDSGASKAAEDVEYYEVYARMDYDGDGIAELYHVVYGIGEDEGVEDKNFIILESEPCDEAPFAAIVMENEAHQFEGHSLHEDVEDIQRIKTVLLRATLDNLNWQNNPQRGVQFDAVMNPEAVQNPQFGQDILFKKGVNVRDAMAWQNVPFFAANSFEMMGYMDEVREDRTGITDASGGINPEGFQNMSATAAHLAAESGVAIADMIVRNLAQGIERAFRGLLKLIVSHSDKPRIVRLRNQWAEFQPDSWNADMDCIVNVGLGGGTRERDMAMLQIVLGLQRELVERTTDLYVKPDQLYTTLEKITEAAGFASAEPFFTNPSPEEVQAAMARSQQGDGSEAQKLQLETQKAQLDAELSREKAQSEMQLAREKNQAEMQLARERMTAELQLAREKMQMEATFGQRISGGSGSPVRMGGAIG